MAQPKIIVQQLDAASVGFPSGTVMLFHQTAAPTGWTKRTDYNDRALRVVNGTVTEGGSYPFSSVFGKTTTNPHALTPAQMPAHVHAMNADGKNVAKRSGYDDVYDALSHWASADDSGFGHSQSTGNAGSSAGHSHVMDIRVQYIDFILATKD